MASRLEFVAYVCDQLALAGKVTSRRMFGEYGLYLDGKFVGCICDGQFFLKRTQAGRALLPNPREAQAYEGSNLYFLIEELEDRELLARVLRATWEELPAPRPKRPKTSSKERK